MDINSGPAAEHKMQQLPTTASDLNNGPTTSQQLWMQCFVRG